MANKAKVPKRLAGVKMPKGLRKGLQRLSADESGRAVISEALQTLAAVVASRQPDLGLAARPLAGQQKDFGQKSGDGPLTASAPRLQADVSAPSV
ncbi:MAG: hypothetical protein KGO51_12905 [Alphaproteobacteria bacterium]|nr:hypothetical protein [Alphaproteobacteria bacterium]